jgi:hypothetical protein
MVTPTGQLFGPHHTAAAAVGDLNAAGKMVLFPVWTGRQAYDQIVVRTTVAGTATWRVGWYPTNSSGLPDWANPTTLTAFDMSVTAGVLTAAVTGTLSTPWVWVAVLVDAYTSNPTVFYTGATTQNNTEFRGLPTSNAGATLTTTYTGVVTGALPTADPGSSSVGAAAPRVLFRKA